MLGSTAPSMAFKVSFTFSDAARATFIRQECIPPPVPTHLLSDLKKGLELGRLFTDQAEVIKRIVEHLGLWEESHTPLDRDPPEKEITFDPSFSQLLF